MFLPLFRKQILLESLLRPKTLGGGLKKVQTVHASASLMVILQGSTFAPGLRSQDASSMEVQVSLNL
jgi:hypothetical protein